MTTPAPVDCSTERTDAILALLAGMDHRTCPFDIKGCKLEPEDPCTVCGQTDAEAQEESRCVGNPAATVKREAAEHIRALRLQLTAEAKRLDWLERNHTLHNSVAILYVVDGYEVQFSTQDGNNLVAETHGETLRDAIDKCMEEVP